jgi:hypothetical protein
MLYAIELCSLFQSDVHDDDRVIGCERASMVPVHALAVIPLAPKLYR